jgi:hypothetical protein
VLVASLALLAGCTTGTDDELAPPPTRTITATPSQSVAPAPASVPVGDGDVSPRDVVWAQGSELHVGTRSVDLSPVEVDAFVVVDGGVFVLSGGELWFTDLSRLRGTGQTDVTQVRVDGDAGRLVVTDTRSGRPLDQAYDTATGKAIRGAVATLTPAELAAGPGRFVVERGAVTDGGRRVPMRGGVPQVLGGWPSDSVFYGLYESGGERQVHRCDVDRRRCRAVGSPVDGPVVFGTGK